MSLKVDLNKENTVEIKPAETTTFSSLTVSRMVDYPTRKQVIVYVREFVDPILLWEGEKYDNIGEWTNADVEERLKELYNDNE